MIYTLGYSHLTPVRLSEIVCGLEARLIDCRFKSVSRRADFGGRQLAILLGSRYEQHGNHLGGFGHVTPGGIEFLRSAQGNLILLCMEEPPGDCHRHHSICAPHFPAALHIYQDELIAAGELQRAIAAGDEYEVAGLLSELLSDSPQSRLISAPLW